MVSTALTFALAMTLPFNSANAQSSAATYELRITSFEAPYMYSGENSLISQVFSRFLGTLTIAPTPDGFQAAASLGLRSSAVSTSELTLAVQLSDDTLLIGGNVLASSNGDLLIRLSIDALSKLLEPVFYPAARYFTESSVNSIYSPDKHSFSISKEQLLSYGEFLYHSSLANLFMENPDLSKIDFYSNDTAEYGLDAFIYALVYQWPTLKAQLAEIDFDPISGSVRFADNGELLGLSVTASFQVDPYGTDEILYLGFDFNRTGESELGCSASAYVSHSERGVIDEDFLVILNVIPITGTLGSYNCDFNSVASSYSSNGNIVDSYTTHITAALDSSDTASGLSALRPQRAAKVYDPLDQSLDTIGVQAEEILEQALQPAIVEFGDAVSRLVESVDSGMIASTPLPMPITTPLPTTIPTAEPIPAGLVYSVNDNSITITDYEGNDATLAIPSYIEGRPVTVIGYGAFGYGKADTLTSLTLPDTLLSIEGSAFYSLRVTSLHIPASVSKIGEGAFQHCYAYITVDPMNVSFISDNGALFTKNMKTLIFTPMSLTSYTIPNTVETIAPYAFFDHPYLKEVILPNSLKRIENNAFAFHTLIDAFYIPASVTYIGESAFMYSDISSFQVDANNANYASLSGSLYTKDMKTLMYYAPVTQISAIIRDTVETIGRHAFASNNLLSTVNIPASVKFISDYAFIHCYALTAITIPESVVSIGSNAFAYCDELKDVYILNPNCVVAGDAFEETANLHFGPLPTAAPSPTATPRPTASPTPRPTETPAPTKAARMSDSYLNAHYKVGLEVGNIAPDFTILLQDGRSYTLSSMRGKPVVLNLCSTWCPPCQWEFEFVDNIYKKYRTQIYTVGISVFETKAEALSYMNQFDYTYPLGFDEDESIAALYEMEFIPQTYFIDANGIIIDYFAGAQDEAEFSRVVEWMLANPDASAQYAK
jgi:peroxiredoxin